MRARDCSPRRPKLNQTDFPPAGHARCVCFQASSGARANLDNRQLLNENRAETTASVSMPQLTRITRDPALMGGKPCIRGMRVTVGTVVGLVATGRTRDEILREYPCLEAEGSSTSPARTTSIRPTCSCPYDYRRPSCDVSEVPFAPDQRVVAVRFGASANRFRRCSLPLPWCIISNLSRDQRGNTDAGAVLPLSA
jgi:uncharacterized protein (DUF433 family)